MNLFQKYLLYINLYNQLKKMAPELFSQHEKVHKHGEMTRTTTWAFQEYFIHDVHDTKYDWHTLQIDTKSDNKRIAEFDGLPANIFLKRMQNSK